MRIILFAAIALVAALAPPVAAPQWGAGGHLAPAQGPVGPARYEWRARPDVPGEVYLYLGGRQVGGWDHAARAYRAYDAARDAWGAPCKVPPVPPPAAPAGALPPAPAGVGHLAAWQLGGVDATKIHQREVHKINGVEVPKIEAVAAIGRGDLADDSSKLWLIVAAKDPQKRKQVLDDLAADPTLAEFRGRTRVWGDAAADPDHWLMQDRAGKPRFALDGEPTICLLDAAGEELWHEAGYTPATLDNLRKADPHYTPDRSPGPKGPKKSSRSADDDDYGALLLVAGGALALILLFGSRTHAP